jgi:hypothetical protein
MTRLMCSSKLFVVTQNTVFCSDIWRLSSQSLTICKQKSCSDLFEASLNNQTKDYTTSQEQACQGKENTYICALEIDEDINTSTIIILSVEILGPITRSQVQ